MTTKVNGGRRPTMVEVARAAGVSLKTVSRVVNNVPTVDSGLVERVLAAIAELGFRRNDIAANLRAGSTSATVGLVIGDMSNPFYSAIAAGAAEVAAQHDTLLLTASSEEDPERERQLLLTLCQRRVDGLLVVPAGDDHSFLRAEIEMGTPVVFLDRPATGVLADTVLLDNAGGASAGVARLLDHSSGPVALLFDSLEIFTMRERLAGARAAMDARGVTLDAAHQRDHLHTPSAAAAATAEMLAGPNPPTAFFCANNRITLGVIWQLWHQDRTADVVGFDDFETSNLMPQPIALVSYDVTQLGRVAAELLFARIAGKDDDLTTTVVPTQLVDRGLSKRPR